MEKWSGKVAVVTGASVGIGAAVAEQLVGHGVKVVGCGRNLENLKEFASTLEKDAVKKIKAPGCFKPFKCDVSKEDEVLALFDFVKSEFGALHICINNAGLGVASPLLSGKTEDFRLQTDVNVIGLLVVTREAVKVYTFTELLLHSSYKSNIKGQEKTILVLLKKYNYAFCVSDLINFLIIFF